ncbi:MAG: ATPase [Nanoarchaeota archaeon]|nr:ATPase [Nanoarchaeota archaeon]
MEKLVPDTSIIIKKILSHRIKKGELKVKELLIHEALLAELEHQANRGRSIGYIGLEEVSELREMKGIEVRFSGDRPKINQVKYAALGEVDAMIRSLTWDEGAKFITADKVQAKVADAKGIDVMFIEHVIIHHRKLKLDKYFDKQTMSVHLREGLVPKAKKGSPGKIDFVDLDKRKLQHHELKDISREIIEEAKTRHDSFLEIERGGSTIAQLGNYRIVITQTPFSDKMEITAVRPVKKMKLEEYKLSEKLLERIGDQAEGILIAGSPGMGKSTFTTALAEFYASQKKIVKTIEAPRDLQLDDNVTQYSLNYGDNEEIHDILLLSRPDYCVFDEMRNHKDFNLFSDLRMAGIGLAGIIHATNAIDAIQRFIGKIELGVIPHVVDTVIFIKNGGVEKVLSVEMMVKVPSGMTEADLARPVVEVKDFETDKLEFEIYSYGEETVVILVQDTKVSKKPSWELAEKKIEDHFERYGNVRVEVVSDHKAKVFVPEEFIARIIGKQGKNIDEIENRLGIKIDVEELKELKQEKEEVGFEVIERKNNIIFFVKDHVGKNADVYSGDDYLFSATVGKKGDIKVNKRSELGRKLLKGFDSKEKINVRA